MAKSFIAIVMTILFISLTFSGCRKAAQQPAQEIKQSAQKTEQQIQQKISQVQEITKNTKITLSENKAIFPKDVVIVQNNITYIDTTPYAILATQQQKDSAKNKNTASKKNPQYNPVPIGTITLGGNKYTLNSDEKNGNVLYLQETKNNRDIHYSIPITKNERIIEKNGRTYIPLGTLQKIVNVAAKNDKRTPVKIEVAK